MNDLLIDGSYAKDLRLFDSNPEMTYDVKTLPSDFNCRDGPSLSSIKHHSMTPSTEQTEQKTTAEPLSSSIILADSELTEDLWLPGEPRVDSKPSNALQDNDNDELHLLQAKSLQEQ